MNKMYYILVIVCLLATSCAEAGSSSSVTETPIPTATASPTQTPMPTVAATPTPDYGIDMQKFTHFPESYEYLLSHLDEFEQAPDPVNNKAAFDKWYEEELVPALGPASEREININGGKGPWRYGYGISNPIREVSGSIRSFYFISDGVVYFSPCFNIIMDDRNPQSRGTTNACVAIFDTNNILGNRVIELVAQGNTSTLMGTILWDPSSDRPDLDWGEIDAMAKSAADYIEDENNIVFGFGYLSVCTSNCRD